MSPSVEIVLTSGDTYMTSAHESVADVRAAIDRGDILVIWWQRVDGTRFEEDAWIAPDSVRMIRSNRS